MKHPLRCLRIIYRRRSALLVRTALILLLLVHAALLFR
jgi:hypothetical protein